MERVLASREREGALGSDTREYLVKWEGYPCAESTWQPPFVNPTLSLLHLSSLLFLRSSFSTLMRQSPACPDWTGVPEVDVKARLREMDEHLVTKLSGVPTGLVPQKGWSHFRSNPVEAPGNYSSVVFKVRNS